MSENVIITGEIKRETEMAVLFSDGERECWIPKSQILERYAYSDSVEITIPEWLDDEKELS